MVTLPTADNTLRRRLPQAGMSVVQVADGSAIAQGAQNLGAGVQALGQGLQRRALMDEREAKVDETKANAINEADRLNQFNGQMAAFEDTLKTDTDYGTQPKRFDETFAKTKDTLLSGITNPFEREQARVKFDALGLSYKNRIETNVQAGQRDTARAATNRIVNDGLEIAAKPGVDPVVHDQTLIATQNALKEARDKGVISAQEYEAQNREFTDRYRERRFDQKMDGKRTELMTGRPPMVASGTSSTPTDYIRYSNQSATRNKPLSPDLTNKLGYLKDMGVTAEVFSGGQDAAGEGGKRTGSTRHDHGGAGDFVFYKDGRRLNWAKDEDRPIFQEIVRRGRAAGITGFGAGPGYMQEGSMHVGFGKEGVWGAGGASAAAPMWLRQAYGDPRSSPPIDPVDSVVSSIIGAESGGVATAKNPNSSATGLGQFTRDTWLSTVKTYRPDLMEGRSEDAVLALRSDPTIAREMTRAHTVENKKELESAGFDATTRNLYLMHFAGKGGGLGLLRAEDNTPIDKVLSSDAIAANPFLRGKNVGDVKAWAATKIGGPSVAAGAQAATRPWSPKDDPDYVNLPYAARERIDRQWAQDVSGASAQFRQEAEQRTNALNLDIIDNKAGRADIDAAREAGWLTDAGKVKSLYDAVDKRDSDLREAGEAERIFADPNYAWNPSEKKDRDYATALVAANDGNQRLAARDETFVDTTVMPVARKTGILAPQVEAQISQAGRSAEPSQVMWGMGIASRLQTEAPEAFGKLPENVRDKVDTFNAYKAFDTPEQMARRLNQPDDPSAVKARTELRKQALVDVKKEVKTDDVVDKVAGGGWFKGDRAPTDPSVLGRFRAEFDNVYADVYGRTGDKDIAMTRATERMSQRWGVSAVNSGRLMVNPPEKNYPTIAGSHDWMAKQIKADLFDEAKRLRPDAVKDASRDVDLAKLGAQLVPDAQTDADLKAGAPASYPVVIKNSWGAYEVLTNDKNRPLRMTFDPKPFEAEELTRTRKTEDGPERRKAIREQLRDPNFDPFPQPGKGNVPARVRGVRPDAPR